MAPTAEPPTITSSGEKLVHRLLPTCAAALGAAEGLLHAARSSVRLVTVSEGRVDGARLDEHQFAAHGLAWYATYVEALRQLLGWAERLEEAGWDLGSSILVEIDYHSDLHDTRVISVDEVLSSDAMA